MSLFKTPEIVRVPSRRKVPTRFLPSFLDTGSQTFEPQSIATVSTALGTTLIVIQSSMVVTPAVAEVYGSILSPLVIGGELQPAPVTVSTALVDPLVIQSSLSLGPAPAFCASVAVDPGVVLIAGTLIQPSSAEASSALVGPGIELGSLVLGPATVTIGSVILNPVVKQGSLNIIPNPATILGNIQITVTLGGYVVLAWDASIGATGYKLYYDSNSGVPYAGQGATEGSSPIDVGNVLTYTLHNLTSQQNWYFAVTAYNPAGESGYSNEVVVFVTTGLFILPGGAFSSTALNNPTLQLSSLTLTPSIPTVGTTLIDPQLLVGGNIDVPPQPVVVSSSLMNPSVIQSSMTVNITGTANVLTELVNPTVGIAGDLPISPIPATGQGSTVLERVIMGSIIIQVDNIPSISSVTTGITSPSAFEGGIVITPAAVEVSSILINPDLAFDNPIVPASAEALSALIDPDFLYGSTSFDGALAEAGSQAIGPGRVLTGVGGGTGTTGDDLVVIYPLKRPWQH